MSHPRERRQRRRVPYWLVIALWAGLPFAYGLWLLVTQTN